MKGVVFDLFGTLCVRTQPEIRIIERYGLNPEAREKLELAVCGYKFDSWDKYMENITHVSGVDDKEGIKNIINSSLQKGLDGIHPQARKVIEERHNHYKIGLVSSSNPNGRKIVDKISDHFDAVTLSYEVGMIKQTPEIFKLHLKKLGVEKACMVGDNVKSDILMSRKAGFGKGVLIGNEKGDWDTVSDLSEVTEAIRSGKAW